MQTIGERLEEARKKKGISIREAAEATKIRGDYLQKFESNQFDIGLTEIYARGFLRNYAGFLKLPADRIINDYAALGRGELRPRQPNREIYGRLDISVASSADAEERGTPPEEAPAGPEPARGPTQPRYPRGGSALPSGPDPAVIFKYVKWGGIAVIALVALLIIKSLFTGGPTAPAERTPASAGTKAAGATQTYSLVAQDTAFVRVTHRLAGDAEGEEIFKGTLNKGQTQVIPWIGPQIVWASAGENVRVEFNGRLFPLGFTGYNFAHMDGPPATR